MCWRIRRLHTSSVPCHQRDLLLTPPTAPCDVLLTDPRSQLFSDPLVAQMQKLQVVHFFLFSVVVKPSLQCGGGNPSRFSTSASFWARVGVVIGVVEAWWPGEIERRVRAPSRRRHVSGARILGRPSTLVTRLRDADPASCVWHFGTFIFQVLLSYLLRLACIMARPTLDIALR
jgi:hypothetical protein